MGGVEKEKIKRLEESRFSTFFLFTRANLKMQEYLSYFHPCALLTRSTCQTKKPYDFFFTFTNRRVPGHCDLAADFRCAVLQLVPRRLARGLLRLWCCGRAVVCAVGSLCSECAGAVSYGLLIG